MIVAADLDHPIVTSWQRIRRGSAACLPLAVGVLPFGLAFGAAASGEMHLPQAAFMSLVVFAGTAQFVAVGMLSDGATYLSVLITGLLINLRHVLLSAAIAPHVWGLPALIRPLAGHLLTDESFAVSMAEFESHGSDAWFYLGVGATLYGAWQAATVVGFLFGARIPQGLGLAFALPASLICLLFLLVRGRCAALVALGAGALCLALRAVVSSTWAPLVATLVSATLGMWVRRPEWTRR